MKIGFLTLIATVCFLFCGCPKQGQVKKNGQGASSQPTSAPSSQPSK